MYTPQDYTGNKFFGTWNKMINMQNMLFVEGREKYIDKLNATRKAELELETLPKCFDSCVRDVSTGLNSLEKNCMRDCYYKNVSSRDDVLMFLEQRMAVESIRAVKERLV